MKYLLIFCFLISFNSFACKEIQYDQNTKSVCRHKWVDKKTKKEMITELTLYKNSCRRFEGSEPEDCYVVKTCGTDFESMSIYKDPKWRRGQCTFRNPEVRVILGSKYEEPRSPAIATLKCEGGIVTKVHIQTPDSKETNCSI